MSLIRDRDALLRGQARAAPMARLKCSMRTAVFLTSEEYTSEPTMGQKGTFLPSSCDMPSASAVFPVPGAPATLQELLSDCDRY